MGLIHQSTGHSDLQVQGRVQERGLLRDASSEPSYGEYHETRSSPPIVKLVGWSEGIRFEAAELTRSGHLFRCI
jgi:hypothetical protein